MAAAAPLPSPQSNNKNNNNLLAIIIDATTFTWTHRALARSAKDKALLSKNKPSAGPATLEDVLSAVLTLANSFCALNRENVVVVIGATEEGVGILYPRKGGEGNLEEVVMGGGGGGGGSGGGGGGRGWNTSGGVSTERVDLGLLYDYVKLGVAELVNRAAERVERRVAQSAERSVSAIGATASTTLTASENGGGVDKNIGGGSAAQPPKKGAAIASALSLALCTINRFMVASHAGVSALANNASLASRYKDDEGVLALIGGGGSSNDASSSSKQSHTRGHNALSPRALIIQASPDRTSDYNALMNCAFASIKSEIVIDGCFIPSGMKDDETSSPYLQQLVDQTGGVYLSVPSGAAQIGGAFSEVLLSVFLPPPQMRHGMNLPKLHNVDFRARCFESGESIDVAQICNQCLSIFKERPKEVCLTCGARVRSSRKSNTSSSGMKKMKLK
ncbi:hypothetical protein ACHAXH_003298 [Discostella pseudostelligera]